MYTFYIPVFIPLFDRLYGSNHSSFISLLLLYYLCHHKFRFILLPIVRLYTSDICAYIFLFNRLCIRSQTSFTSIVLPRSISLVLCISERHLFPSHELEIDISEKEENLKLRVSSNSDLFY